MMFLTCLVIYVGVRRQQAEIQTLYTLHITCDNPQQGGLHSLAGGI